MLPFDIQYERNTFWNLNNKFEFRIYSIFSSCFIFNFIIINFSTYNKHISLKCEKFIFLIFSIFSLIPPSTNNIIISCSTLVRQFYFFHHHQLIICFLQYSNISILYSFSNFPHLKTIHINIFSLNFKDNLSSIRKEERIETKTGWRKFVGRNELETFKKTSSTPFQRRYGCLSFLDKFWVCKNNSICSQQVVRGWRLTEKPYETLKIHFAVHSESFHGNNFHKLRSQLLSDAKQRRGWKIG